MPVSVYYAFHQRRELAAHDNVSQMTVHESSVDHEW